MGYGGILAAMAAGLGTGIVKNVENGWKEEAAQKEMDWRSKEYELGRQHDITLENLRSENRIKEAAIETREKMKLANYTHQLTNNSQDKKDEDVTNGMDAKLKVVDNLNRIINSKESSDEQKAWAMEQLPQAQKEVEIYRDGAAYQDVYNRAPAGMKAVMEATSGIKSAGYKQWQDNENKRIEQEKIKTEQENTARQQTQEVARQKAAKIAEDAKIRFAKSFNNGTTTSWYGGYNQITGK